MSRQKSPASKSFEERWPSDAGQLEDYARPIYPIALGGVAGVVFIPILLGGLLATWPLPYLAVVVGRSAALTGLIARSAGQSGVDCFGCGASLPGASSPRSPGSGSRGSHP